jgi:hypothetical protein
MGKIAIKTNATADISSILPEVLRFYDATVTFTITLASGTNNITSWGDRSVNNVPATQTVGSEQPIYNPATSTGLRTINMGSIKNFLINFGVAGFDGFLYIADAIHGVLQFVITVPPSTQNVVLKCWRDGDFSRNVQNFTSIIGIVLTSQITHKNIIENYFGSKSQNLKYSNLNSLDHFFLTQNSLNTVASHVKTTPAISNTTYKSFSNAFFGLTFLIFARLYKVSSISGMFQNCTNLEIIPPFDTSLVTNFLYPYSFGINITHISASDHVNTITYTDPLRSNAMSALSLDNFIISIAAGIANNLSKNVTYIRTTSDVNASLTNIDRRKPSFTNIQDTIPDWNNIIDDYENGINTEDQTKTLLQQRVDNYNQEWKTWEQTLRNTNESLNGVQYNFSNGTVSGQKALFWILAKKSLTIPLGAAPTTLTTGVTRSYRSNSGLTVSGSNVDAWTPVTGTSNQTISGLTTQTINGITCVMFSSTKTITLNFSSINGVTNAIVYIGTLYGYVKRISITATNLRISTNTTTELPIISIMVTTTAVNETEVLSRLGFYGSFQEFNYTANTLTSANIQLTAV